MGWAEDSKAVRHRCSSLKNRCDRTDTSLTKNKKTVQFLLGLF